MKKIVVVSFVILVVGTIIFFAIPFSNVVANIDETFFDKDPDIPAILKDSKDQVSKEEFLSKRDEAWAMRRGVNNGKIPEPGARSEAVAEMDRQAQDIARMPASPEKNRLLAGWTAIGPNPIIAGGARYSGRTISIAVHPTNPDIVYAGTAQGGLYRSTNGGTSWVPLMDGAQSLAIGALALAPSNPEILYVGTGEPNFSADSFFGVGVYRINNASTTATLSGPFSQNGAAANVLAGRSVSEVVVHPTDPNTIFVSTTSGVGGIGGVAFNVLPSRGIYRSTNAAGAAPTFEKLTGLAGNTNSSVRDIAIDPANPNILVASLVAAAPTGGYYRSTDALAPSPTFTQTLSYASGTTTSELNGEITSVHPVGNPDATFYAATGNLGGRALRSTDGGATWIERIDNNFCTPQCFYDIAIDVDPTNADRVYLAGAPAVIAAFSTNGGTSFTEGGAGVHVDSHALAVAPSNPSIVYLGTDGGIYKSTNSGASYVHLNTAQFYATQFMSIAVHPTDNNFTIGGTQDNGTLFYDPAGSSWTRINGGDGGFTGIDQNAPDTTNVRMYHLFFTNSTQIGYSTRPTTASGWSLRGCFSGTPANGINCGEPILFYAPFELGPGNPNTTYLGSDRLYRSADLGVNHTIVSQAFGTPLSAIGISPQNDNVRIIGLTNGTLMGTTTGANPLVDLDPANQVTNGYIARTVIDPNNVNTAYVTVSNFGVANVFKTTNLNASPPTWTNISGTIPQVPVSAFVVHPTNSNILYAGTDIGVYVSTDAGASWAPFGTGLPRSAVFDMAVTNGSPRKLRIATHGKGMYEIAADPATAPAAFVDFDGDQKTDLSIFRPGPGEWWYLRSSNGSNGALTFGSSTDVITPGDYTGDGKTDVALFRPSTGNWFVLRSEDFSFYAFPFGTNGDVPAPGDFDADGKTDATVFRPSTNTWFSSLSGGGTSIQAFGAAGDVPVVADYDGDGRSDIAIYRPSLGQWWLNRSTAGLLAYTFGNPTDKTVQADFTGDGKADSAIWRPSTGEWFVLRSENLSFYSFPFGTTGDIPVQGDYDGDGRSDAGVFRPSSNTWFVQRSTAGTLIQSFGVAGDRPVPNAYVRN